MKKRPPLQKVEAGNGRRLRCAVQGLGSATAAGETAVVCG